MICLLTERISDVLLDISIIPPIYSQLHFIYDINLL